MKNAVATYGHGVDPSRVLSLLDATFFGSGTEGFLLTDAGIYANGRNANFSFQFADLDCVALQTEKSDSLLIRLKEDNCEITLKANNGIIKIEPFFEFLSAISAASCELVTVDDKMPVAELSPDEINDKIKDGDLYALLSICSNEELAPLVKVIAGALIGKPPNGNPAPM